MSDLKKSDIEHVANLANLSVSDEEIDKYTEQLSDVVGHIGQLEEVDTEGVEPTSQTTGLSNIARDDKVNMDRILPDGTALSQANDQVDNYFAVPMILKEKDLT